MVAIVRRTSAERVTGVSGYLLELVVCMVVGTLASASFISEAYGSR